MSVQRIELKSGSVRYRARVKSHGQEVATRLFTRRVDAIAWEQDQSRRLRLGEWVDPRRGRVQLSVVATAWLGTRDAVKQRTAETDRAAWRNYIEPALGTRPVASITSATVAEWVSGLVAKGLAPTTAGRALATLRAILAHGVADDRLTRNVAVGVRRPRGGQRREGHALTVPEAHALMAACSGPYADLVLVLALSGLRWGELAGLQAGDLVSVPGRGLRVQRAVLASGGGGELFIDSLKTHQARTVPLVEPLVAIVDKWADGKASTEWLFAAPEGGPPRESNWKRSIRWTDAKRAIGLPSLRVHDLRHTAASVWIAAGADPKVVQRVLGHATATMTLDLYGHLNDASLWEAARRVGDNSGATRRTSRRRAK